MPDLIQTAKTVYDLAKKGVTVELQEKLMELREEALELQEENLALRKENLELREKAEFREKLKFVRKVYFRDSDEIPFCPYCYEKSEILIHFTGPKKRNDAMFYDCQECGRIYRMEEDGDIVFYDKRRI